MNAKDLAEYRNRVARAALAASGEVLPETDRRGQGAGRVREVDRCSSSSEQTLTDTPAPVTAEALTPDERSIYDELMTTIDWRFAAVDASQHCALVARDTMRARTAARSGS